MLLSFTIIIITTLGLTSITVVGLAGGDRIVLAQPKNSQQEDEDIANNMDGDGCNNGRPIIEHNWRRRWTK